MKAIVMKKQGSTNLLEYQDLAMPTPKEDEVLIRVHAATVTRGDVILRNISPLLHLPMLLMGIKKKRIQGHEFAGEVVDVGKKVSKFKVGDKVFGTTTGLNVGANAEYVCVPETWRTGLIAIMPTNASFE